jgi:dTMP kinase
MINSYLQSKSELDDHAIHLLFAANRWECAWVQLAAYQAVS